MIVNNRILAWWYGFISIALLILFGIKSCLVPLSHDEVATFYYYIQTAEFWPFFSHNDANNHVLNSLLAYFSERCFGIQAWALRLPQTMALACLLIVVWKMSTKFNSNLTKVLFWILIVGSCGLISLFSLCRGYGISVCMFLAAAYGIQNFLINTSTKAQLIKICFFLQLALAANVSMFFPILVLSGLILITGSLKKWNPWNYLLFFIHLMGLFYWYCFAQWLNNNGALYYGIGDSFWSTSVVSLINFLWPAAPLFVGLTCMLILVVIGLITVLKSFKIFTQSMFWFVSFVLTVLCIFSAKFFFKINYPEDRTGIYLYLMLVMMFISGVNQMQSQVVKYGLLVLIILLIVPSWLHFNTQTHPWKLYETFPDRFYTYINKQTQYNSTLPVIGGHRVREFIWGHQNLKNKGALPHMYAPEQFEFISDWCIAYPQDSIESSPYYTIVDRDCKSGFYLYKRKFPLNRLPLMQMNSKLQLNASQEYFTLIDTVLNQTQQNALYAEWNMQFLKPLSPEKTWMVMELKDSLKQTVYYGRTPLSLVRSVFKMQTNWRSNMVSPYKKQGFKEIILYVWNPQRNNLSIQINSLQIKKLVGPGSSLYSNAVL